MRGHDEDCACYGCGRDREAVEEARENVRLKEAPAIELVGPLPRPAKGPTSLLGALVSLLSVPIAAIVVVWLVRLVLWAWDWAWAWP